jgi:hypothetical protein
VSSTGQIRNPRRFKSAAWLAVLASVGLAFTLATRDLSQLSVPGHLAVVSTASAAIPWQKLETDAVLWVPPITLAHILQASEFRPPLPERATLREALLDERLHNRPPPCC